MGAISGQRARIVDISPPTLSTIVRKMPRLANTSGFVAEGVGDHSDATSVILAVVVVQPPLVALPVVVAAVVADGADAHLVVAVAVADGVAAVRVCLTLVPDSALPAFAAGLVHLVPGVALANSLAPWDSLALWGRRREKPVFNKYILLLL